MQPKRFDTLTAQEQLARYDEWLLLCEIKPEDDEPLIQSLDGLGIGGSYWEREFER
jgi:hypothetical protein